MKLRESKVRYMKGSKEAKGKEKYNYNREKMKMWMNCLKKSERNFICMYHTLHT